MANIQLVVKGEVWMPIDVAPASVTFSRLTAESAKDPASVQKVTIKNNMEKDAELSGLRSTDPTFSPELTVIEPGKKFELAVRFAAPPKQGNTSGTIELTTNIPEMEKITIPVNVFVAPDVEVMPAVLSLPAEQATAMTRQLNVRNNAKTPLELSELKASNPDVKVTLETTQPGTLFKINVAMPAGYKVPPQGDMITFKTTNPSMPEVKVPVSQMPPTPPAPANASTRTGLPDARSVVGNREPEPSMEGVRLVDPKAAGAKPATPGRATTEQIRPTPPPTRGGPAGQQIAPGQPRPPAQGQTPPPTKPDEAKPETKQDAKPEAKPEAKK